MRRKILIYIPLKLKYSITIFKAYDTFMLDLNYSFKVELMGDRC